MSEEQLPSDSSQIESPAVTDDSGAPQSQEESLTANNEAAGAGLPSITVTAARVGKSRSLSSLHGSGQSNSYHQTPDPDLQTGARQDPEPIEPPTREDGPGQEESRMKVDSSPIRTRGLRLSPHSENIEDVRKVHFDSAQQVGGKTEFNKKMAAEFTKPRLGKRRGRRQGAAGAVSGDEEGHGGGRLNNQENEFRAMDNLGKKGIRKRSYSFTEGHCKGPPGGQHVALAGGKRRKQMVGSGTLASGGLHGLSGVVLGGGSEASGSLRRLGGGAGSGQNSGGGQNAGGGKLGGGGGSKNAGGSKGTGSSVLPSKFLLGGNIHDPLNLNSLSDERVSRLVNAVTPESSPVPTPKHRKEEYKIEVIIPPNISDPLNLNAEEADSVFEAKLLTSPLVKKRKPRHRKRPRRNLPSVDLKTLPGPQPRSASDAACYPGGEDAKEEGGSQEATTANQESTPSDDPNAASRGSGPRTADNPAGDTEETAAGGRTERRGSHHFHHHHHHHHHHKSGTGSACPKKPDSAGKKDAKSGQTGQARNPTDSTSQGDDGHKGAESGRPEGKKGRRDRFQYGNYNQYYGYRNPGKQQDLRLPHFKSNWFEGKDVLDIGCNIGHITLTVGKQFRPRRIVGLDIDKSLVEIARKNVRHYIRDARNAEQSHYPRCMSKMFGPLNPLGVKKAGSSGPATTGPSAGDNPTVSGTGGEGSAGTAGAESGAATAGAGAEGGGRSADFPYNVEFYNGNYVLESDQLLETVHPEFDTIMCLSTTKWMHLNNGDAGMKRAFKRMYSQLRPGGLLILECQEFSSYKKRKKLNDVIFKNYQSIKFKPENFANFLVHEVGFSRSETVAIPPHSSKGFQRPLQIFIKRAAGERDTRCGDISASTTPGLYGISPHSYNPSFTPYYSKYTPRYSSTLGPTEEDIEGEENESHHHASSNVSSPSIVASGQQPTAGPSGHHLLSAASGGPGGASGQQLGGRGGYYYSDGGGGPPSNVTSTPLTSGLSKKKRRRPVYSGPSPVPPTSISAAATPVADRPDADEGPPDLMLMMGGRSGSGGDAGDGQGAGQLAGGAQDDAGEPGGRHANGDGLGGIDSRGSDLNEAVSRVRRGRVLSLDEDRTGHEDEDRGGDTSSYSNSNPTTPVYRGEPLSGEYSANSTPNTSVRTPYYVGFPVKTPVYTGPSSGCSTPRNQAAASSSAYSPVYSAAIPITRHNDGDEHELLPESSYHQTASSPQSHHHGVGSSGIAGPSGHHQQASQSSRSSRLVRQRRRGSLGSTSHTYRSSPLHLQGSASPATDECQPHINPMVDHILEDEEEEMDEGGGPTVTTTPTLSHTSSPSAGSGLTPSYTPAYTPSYTPAYTPSYTPAHNPPSTREGSGQLPGSTPIYSGPLPSPAEPGSSSAYSPHYYSPTGQQHTSSYSPSYSPSGQQPNYSPVADNGGIGRDSGDVQGGGNLSTYSPSYSPSGAGTGFLNYSPTGGGGYSPVYGGSAGTATGQPVVVGGGLVAGGNGGGQSMAECELGGASSGGEDAGVPTNPQTPASPASRTSTPTSPKPSPQSLTSVPEAEEAAAECQRRSSEEVNSPVHEGDN